MTMKTHNLRRKNSLVIGCLLLVLHTVIPSARAQGTEVAFEIPEPDLVPEGIAFDLRSERFFVSSTFKRKIVQVNKEGRSTDFIKSGQHGLLGVVGMRVDEERRILWALSGNAGPGMPMINPIPNGEGVSRVHKFNLDTRELLGMYELSNQEERNFLNDLAVAKNGDVYITDTRTKRIYKIDQATDELNLFVQLEKSMSPNGIDFSSDQQFLFIAVYGGKNVVRLNLGDKSLKTIELPEGERISADGLCFFNNTLLAIQPWNKERIITQYKLDPSLQKIGQFRVLDSDNANFSQPTTGVIVGDYLYCIANSQLQLFKKIYTDGMNKKELLNNPVVLRIQLERGAW